MRKYIHIRKEDREFIMKVFGVTGRTVMNAIRFDSERGDTDLARRIRKVALVMVWPRKDRSSMTPRLPR